MISCPPCFGPVVRQQHIVLSVRGAKTPNAWVGIEKEQEGDERI